MTVTSRTSRSEPSEKKTKQKSFNIVVGNLGASGSESKMMEDVPCVRLFRENFMQGSDNFSQPQVRMKNRFC